MQLLTLTNIRSLNFHPKCPVCMFTPPLIHLENHRAGLHCAKTTEPIKMPFGGDLCGFTELFVRWNSRSTREGDSTHGGRVHSLLRGETRSAIGDAACCQIILFYSYDEIDRQWITVYPFHHKNKQYNLATGRVADTLRCLTPEFIVTRCVTSYKEASKDGRTSLVINV